MWQRVDGIVSQGSDIGLQEGQGDPGRTSAIKSGHWVSHHNRMFNKKSTMRTSLLERIQRLTMSRSKADFMLVC